MMPLPPDLLNLPVIEAKPWLQIYTDEENIIEGPAFDREGNLYLSSPPTGIIYRVTPKQKIDIIFNKKEVIVDGIAMHRDGRLFAVCISGELLSMNPDGSNPTYVYPKYRGKTLSMNDLVFDSKGNLYVTDFRGTIVDPAGGVYRLSTDGATVEPVLQNLVLPNGVSLSPAGDILWVAETTRNTILRITLMEDGITPGPVDGVVRAYYSTGCYGPDSNKVDKEGNLYQCIMGQGRAVVINMYGIPIANVVIPGREEGKYLRSTNLAFKPGTDEGYITAGGRGGAWICRFKGLAEGLPLFSHT